MEGQHFKVINTTLDSGSVICIVIPTNHVEHGSPLVVHCHGYRPVGIPLQASINPQDALYAQMLAGGFIVATTSFRREGYILQDAIDDVELLRAYVVAEVLQGGCPARCLLYAESMGGAVAALTAERHPDHFDGVLALGAALLIQDDPPEAPIRFTHRPAVPILFLSNESEVGAPQDYISRCAQSGAAKVPALWSVARGGHIVMHDEEILAGWVGLLQWLSSGSIEPSKDVTFSPPPQPFTSRVSFDAGGAFGKVVDVNLYGELTLDFHLFDLNKLFIFEGTTFQLDLLGPPESGGAPRRSFSVYFGGFPFVGVPESSWTAGSLLSGNIRVRKHTTGTSANTAAQDSGARVGDTIYIHEKPKYSKTPMSEAMKRRLALLAPKDHT